VPPSARKNAVRPSWPGMRPQVPLLGPISFQKREGVRDQDAARDIGRWIGSSSPPLISGLADWAKKRSSDAAVWTALGFPSKGHPYRRSADEIIKYLQTLTGEGRSKAETYVRRAPKQIETVYRHRIEADLGWVPVDGD
jgi:hypothetical protein